MIADCGRLGADGRYYDLLARAATIILVTRATLGEVVRLRDRVAAVTAAVRRRGGPGAALGVLVVADHKNFANALAEVGQALGQAEYPVSVIGGIAHEPKSAEMLRGEWGGKLDKSLLIRTAREVAGQLVGQLAARRGASRCRPARWVAGQRTCYAWARRARRPGPRTASLRAASPRADRAGADRVSASGAGPLPGCRPPAAAAPGLPARRPRRRWVRLWRVWRR